MSSSQAGNVVETLGAVVADGNTISSSHPNLDMGSTDVVPNIETDFQLSSSDIVHGSSKDRKETSVVYRGKKVPPAKKDVSKRPTRIYPPSNKPSSSIPLPVKSPKSSSPTKVASISMSRTLSRSASRPTSVCASRTSQVTNKHTLEIQFINKRKRLCQLKKDLLEKQKPVLDLYQNLLQIKKRLEDLGKFVHLEDVKLLPFEQIDLEGEGDGTGESVSPEAVREMQDTIEEIPRTLMDICRNLLTRRAVIVDLLESVTKSEISASALADKIETLKVEGVQLQKNLDAVISEDVRKIDDLVVNWQKLIHEKCNMNTNAKIEDLEDKIRQQERLTQESNQVIMELQRKLDDKKCYHDKSVQELNIVIHGLKDQIQKLEIELENEKKAATDYKSRSNTNAHNSKMLRNKIAELENEKKASETITNELNRKVKLLQDQLKHKEAQWTKEKEDLSKNLKHQENLLQKLNADKNKFETRLEEVEGARTTLEDDLQQNIEVLTREMEDLKKEYSVMAKERDEAADRCKEMEEYISKMGLDFKETMHMVSNSIEWGKDVQGGVSEAQKYSQSLVKDIMIRECQDKIKQLEKENNFHRETIALVENIKTVPTETEKAVLVQHDIVTKYKQLLAESEQKLTEKSQEVAKLTSEIRQLKVRQEHLEEINQKCPTENLQMMVEEGRQKLGELMKKSLESEQRILHYENVIDKQSKQMNEMENLLRYRENMAGVLKASRDELVLEKESLTRYSHEMRTVLAEVSKEGKMKDRLIKELQEKIDLRERQIGKLEKEVKELEANLMMTNEKRFKLQETIGSMEKELQSTKAHVNQLADINTRYDIVPDLNSSNPSEGSLKIKITVG